ncbi:alpha/beta fold hydrolase [Streptomyces aureus]
MNVSPGGATIPSVDHHRVSVNGTELHYVSAGTAGSPVVLVHGFPETWWAFHKLIPLLSGQHRVFAVDLRGFGDSATAKPEHDSATSAQDLSELIARLDLGPVHLTGQDISGPTTFRVAATHPNSSEATERSRPASPDSAPKSSPT